MTGRARLACLPPVLVGLITVITFLPALDGQFLNWDDSTLFTKNLDYRGLGPSQLRWMFTTALAGHYMPLTWLTLGLNYTLGGMNPWGYHLLALLLHGVNAMLFYLVACRLLTLMGAGAGDRRAESAAVRAGAAVAALVFAIHPQRVESVAWVTERGSLVSGGLYLVAVLAYLRAARADGLRWRWDGVVSLAAFAAALLAKGMALSLPVTLLILDVYPLRRWRGRWGCTLVEKIPYAAVAVLGAAIVVLARTRGAQWSDLADYGLGARLAFVAYSLWFYPSSTLWPIGLTPLYEAPLHAGPLEARFLAPFLALIAVTATLVVLRHRFPGGLAAWAHAAVVVAPVSGIAHSGNQLVSDRYSYLAGLGFALVAGYGVTWAARQRRAGRLSGWVSAVGAGGVALALTALALGTWGQSGVWHDSETLWRWAVNQDPECARCQAILGEAIVYAADGGPARLDEGEAHVRRAIALRPSMAVSYYTLGTILLARGQHAPAETSLSTYTRLAPGDFHGPARLALVYLVQDRADLAMPLLQRAAQLAPHGPPPAPPRAREPEASGTDPLFAECLRLLGNEPEDLEYLGQALIQRGKSERAVPPLLRAAELAPSAPGPRFWLVRAYEASGQRERAGEQLAILRRLDPGAADRAPVR